jgi:hypothetical protein
MSSKVQCLHENQKIRKIPKKKKPTKQTKHTKMGTVRNEGTSHKTYSRGFQKCMSRRRMQLAIKM